MSENMTADEAAAFARRCADAEINDPDGDLARMSRIYKAADDTVEWLRAEAKRLRAALEYARPLVKKWCHYQGNTKEFFEQTLMPIDSALGAGSQPMKPDLAAEREIVSRVMIPPAPDARLDRANQEQPPAPLKG